MSKEKSKIHVTELSPYTICPNPKKPLETEPFPKGQGISFDSQFIEELGKTVGERALEKFLLERKVAPETNYIDVSVKYFTQVSQALMQITAKNKENFLSDKDMENIRKQLSHRMISCITVTSLYDAHKKIFEKAQITKSTWDDWNRELFDSTPAVSSEEALKEALYRPGKFEHPIDITIEKAVKRYANTSKVTEERLIGKVARDIQNRRPKSPGERSSPPNAPMR